MERREIINAMRTLDEQLAALDPGERRAALKQTYERLCLALQPNVELRRGNELPRDWEAR